MGVLFLLGAFCWTVVDPSQPIFAAGRMHRGARLESR
jgi:hypothetical protein